MTPLRVATTPTSAAQLPLAGIRVLDLSRLVAGNKLSLAMADFGAEVLKIEDPGTGDALRDWKAGGHSVFWKVYARNKKSVTLNLRDAEAREILLDLVETADVLIESFKFGTMEKLGLGPDVLHGRNPRLVMVRISGWGQTGPYKTRPGFGTLVEAFSGLASKTGFPGMPPTLPNVALADMVAGLSGAFAVLAALRARDNGAPGQVIDLSLLEPLVSIIGPDAAIYETTGEVPVRIGNRLSVSAPRNTYRTADGHWLAISASMQPMCERLFRVMGQPELITDPRFRTNSDRMANVDALDDVVQAWVGAHDLDALVDLCEREGITAGPVYNVQQLMDDPHVIEREVLVDVADPDLGDIPMHNVTPRLSATPGGIRHPAPALGQHTDEILQARGRTAEQLAALRARGAI
ncbi:MAG: CoA transferase [Gemmatimonadaceae bacterium]|nr:CoA transferase [Gemmatimonadaceae bacterium]